MIKSGRVSSREVGGRVALPSNPQNEQVKHYPSPVLGLVTSGVLSSEQEASCAVLENFIPTNNGVRVRGGSQKRVNIPSGVTYMFEYQSGITQYFVASSTSIYAFNDATGINTSLTTPIISGQTSSDYSHIQTQTDGGSFLILVNGVNNMQNYNGTSWQAVTSSSSPFAVTGIATTELNYVWNYNNRMFFIQKNSFNVWYLPINSVAGTAVRLPLTGLFSDGSALLFGTTLSINSGSGYSDKCIFMTNQGQFAIYSGDPSSATNWKLEGVYSISRPLGKNAHFKITGDVLIATEKGLLSVARAMQTSEKIESVAVSRAIQKDWQSDVSRISSAQTYKIAKLTKQNIIFILPPKEIGFIYCLNLDTEAWSKISGWDCDFINGMNGNLYIGKANGSVLIGNTGGFDDDDKGFLAKLCYNFLSISERSGLKICTRIKQAWRHTLPFNNNISIASDYASTFMTAPDGVVYGASDFSKWDIAQWDVSAWGADAVFYKIYENWQGVSGQGEVLAPQIQIYSAQPYRLDCELIGIELGFRQAGFIK